MSESVDAETYRAVRDFLLEEAKLLDDHRFDEWLDCLSADIEYRVPVRVTREVGADPFPGMDHIYDDRATIEKRIDRLHTDYAWAEDPPTRTRHFLSNVRVYREDGELHADANLLLSLVSGDEPDPNFLVGERRDVLTETDDGYEITDREVFLDQATLPVQLSVFV